MIIEIHVSLVEGTDKQNFIDSFSGDITVLYSLNENELVVSADESFLEIFYSDARVAYSREYLLACATYPPYPPKQFQEATPTASTAGKNNRSKEAIAKYGNIRPGYPGNIPAETEKDYLGSHFMNHGLYIDSSNPNYLENPLSDRLPIGSHNDDLQGENGPPSSRYTARFFGKDVDIVTLEGGSAPGSIDAELLAEKYKFKSFDRNLAKEYNFEAVYHPDFAIPVEGEGASILPNRDTNNPAFPDGWYNIPGTRINLRNWGGGPNTDLLTRYNDTTKSKEERNVLMAHAMGTLSAAGGLVGGFAKKANLWPNYADNNRSLVGDIRAVRDWHKTKSRNPNIKYGNRSDLSEGVRNPTILLMEVQFRKQKTHFFPVDFIKSFKHKGTTVSRPEGGWGSNLQPFVDANMIPWRFKDPDTENQYFWTISTGDGPIHGVNNSMKVEMERAWDDGILVILGGGNSGEVYARRDEIEYNSYFKLDPNSRYFEARIEGESGLSATIAGYDTRNVGRKGKTIYPFRSYFSGTKRNKGLEVAAGVLSETNPILEHYTSRGPGIDIIGDGSGTWAAYPMEGFPFETKHGHMLDLDPGSSMYDNTAFPFSGGDRVILKSGSATLSEWQNYLTNYMEIPEGGNIFNQPYFKRWGNRTPQPGDLIILPPNPSSNVPSNIKIDSPGWRWGGYGGTSCAIPSVGGRCACIMEEFLHKHKRWPTPNETKDLLLSQAREVDLEAPSTYWNSLPPPNFDLPEDNLDQYLLSTSSLLEENARIAPESSNFETLIDGELTPTFSGWTPINKPTKPIDSQSMGSIKSVASGGISIEYIYSKSNQMFMSTAPLDEFGRKIDYSFLSHGSQVTISGVPGDVGAAINNQTIFVGAVASNAFRLYSDADLQNPIDSSPFPRLNPRTLRIAEGGKVGYETTLTANGTNFYTGNEILKINIGDLIIVSGSNDAINTGTYRVKTINSTGNITLESEQASLDANPSDDIAVTDFSGLTFSILQVDSNPANLEQGITVNLQNYENYGPAGLEYDFLAQAGSIYEFKVDSSNLVGFELIRPNGSVLDGSNNLIASGEINPGKAHTTVTFAATDAKANLSSAILFDQLQTPSWDFDGNGSADALTDGLLLVRYLFNLTGTALTKGIITEDSVLTTEEVEDILASTKAIQDIDGDGKVDALTDGLLLLRYLFNLKGDQLIEGAVSAEASRRTADEIVEYIERLMPRNNDVATYGYRDSQNSAVIHNKRQSLRVFESDLLSVQNWLHGDNSRTGHPYLDSYTNVVGGEMFDQDIFRNSIYDSVKPLIYLNAVGWQWLDENGAFFDNNVMGSISANGVSGNTFTDVNGVSRTIRDLWWTEGQRDWYYPGDPETEKYLNRRTPNGILCFSLDNPQSGQLTNSDFVFAFLEVNGVSFSREDAYFVADSFGKAVWYWHISTAPIEGSDFKKLGTSLTSWSMINADKVKNKFRWQNSNSTDINLKLRVSNLNASSTYSSTIKNISAFRVTQSGRIGAAARSNVGWDSWSYHDAAGTPPLRAAYNPLAHEHSDISKHVLNYSKPISSSVSPQGAVFPSVDASLSSTNDFTLVALGEGYTKYGFGKDEEDINVEPETELITSEIFSDIGWDEDREDPDLYQEIDKNNIAVGTITIAHDIQAPDVDSASSFTLGPVEAYSSVPTNTLQYRWQKSSNGSSWTNIAADDSIYTGAHTNEMTITGTPPAGEYYRCEVRETIDNHVDVAFTNTVQTPQTLETTFYLWVDTDTATNGFVSSSSMAPNAGQVSENPAFSSNVDGTNDGPVSLGNNNINILGVGYGIFKLECIAQTGALNFNQSFTLNFTKGVNSDGTGGTSGGSISTATGNYGSYASLVGWSWSYSNIPSEVLSTFNSTSDNPVKVQLTLN